MERKRCFHIGLTLFLTGCAILVFYDTFFLSNTIFTFLARVVHILVPVLYGAALAYLLAPITDFFDAILGGNNNRRASGAPRPLIRAASLVLTWLIVALLFYALLHLLIPSVVESVVQLAGNMETYYNTVLSWVQKLLEDNPSYENIAMQLMDRYYGDLLDVVTQKWLPQAQQLLVVVTGGIWSVLIFAKNLLIGIVVSCYLLATKERSANRARKMLYAFASEEHYAFILRGVGAVDKIFSGFVRGKLLDSLIIGILCFAGAAIFKFPYAPLISVIVGATNIIPVFGPFLGAVPSALLILLADPLKCLYFILFVIVLQQIDGNIIGPKILGGSTGLSGFGVMVAILLGGGFGSVLGMFLGVPIVACLATACHAWVDFRLKKRSAPLSSEHYRPLSSVADTQPPDTSAPSSETQDDTQK